MDKIVRRARRKISIRKKISGTSERPRMCISRSNKNTAIQIVDDLEGKTICSLSTSSKAVQDKVKANSGSNVASAKVLGEEIAKIAGTKGVSKVVFDRAGYPYHGVVKAVAEAAREGGLEF